MVSPFPLLPRAMLGRVDLEHPMSSSQPLQLDIPGVAKVELPAALYQRLQQRRHEYLPAQCLGRNPCRQDDGPAKEVLALLDGLAGVKADADPNRLIRMLLVVGGQGPLDTDGALQRPACS